MTDSLCPCGSQKLYVQCCSPIISGEKKAATAEALMRSRYTAFTEKNVDYLFDSMAPDLQENTSHDDIKDFVDAVESWIKLEIIEAPTTSSYSTEATVEFAAYFKYKGQKERIHEHSIFTKINTEWRYAGHLHQCGGAHHHAEHNHEHDDHQEPYVAQHKIGRNDPCLCGSGKKYKKCCGA